MAAVPRKSAHFSPWPSFHRMGNDEGMVAAVARMAEAAGVPPARLMADFAQLAIGPGRIDFSDYERLRLYDEALWAHTDRRAMVGARRGRDLARAVNFRHDCFALASDHLAADAYLSAHGLPTVPILAIYRAGLATPGRRLIRTRDELRAFLESQGGQPLLAQPVEGGRARRLFGPGHDAAADICAVLDAVRDGGETSWLFRPHLAEHPDAVSDGDRLSTVRVLTANTDFGPVMLRALWRLGGRDDIVATLDAESGAVRAIFPAGSPHRAQAAPSGFAVPEWALVKATAIEGMRLMSQFSLIGWDIASTAQGPVILGLDPAPDVELHQLADRRGLLDGWFHDFIADRRRLAAEHRRLS
jgi:hypothetical protein